MALENGDVEQQQDNINIDQINNMIREFQEDPEKYEEWKKQQPNNFNTEWDGHTNKKVKDYSIAERIMALRMNDSEILEHLGLDYIPFHENIVDTTPPAHLSDEDIQEYREWKRQQPEKFKTEWDGHTWKRVRDYRPAEIRRGLEMNDPEILEHLNIY